MSAAACRPVHRLRVPFFAFLSVLSANPKQAKVGFRLIAETNIVSVPTSHRLHRLYWSVCPLPVDLGPLECPLPLRLADGDALAEPRDHVAGQVLD